MHAEQFLQTPPPPPTGRLLPQWFGAASGGSIGDAVPAQKRGASVGVGDQQVLLVEDNAINQVVAVEFLTMMGLKVRLARSGVEALAACEQAAPDLVLMDIQMPGMDGLECTRQLRARQREGSLAAFPILALTAHALESDVRASAAAGMDEHLTKPIDFITLRARLRHWLGLADPS